MFNASSTEAGSAKVATRQWIETAEKVEDWLSTLDNEPKSIDIKSSLPSPMIQAICG